MAAGTFSCALNAPITQEETPHLHVLLRRTLTDSGLSSLHLPRNQNRTPDDFALIINFQWT